MEVSFKLPRAAAKDLWRLAKCGDARLKDIGILRVQIRELHSVNPDEFLSWNGRRENRYQKGFEGWSYNSLHDSNERRGIQSQYGEELADYHGDIPAQWPHQHAPPHYTLYNSSQPRSQTLREKHEFRQRSGHVAEKEVHKTKIIGISRGVLTNETIPIVADFLLPTPGWLLESALCISFRRHGKCEVACQTGSEKINYRPRPGSSRYEQMSRVEMAANELLSGIDGRYKVYTNKSQSEKELSDEVRPRKSACKDGSFTQCSSESIRILESLANSLENADEKAGTGISGEYPTNQTYEQNLQEPIFYEGQHEVVSRQPRGGYNPDQRYGSGMQVNFDPEIGHVERPAQYSENEGFPLNTEKQIVALDFASRGGRVDPYTACQAAEYHQGNIRQEKDDMIEGSAIRERDSFRKGYKDPAQVFGSGTLRDYLEREKEIYEASKKDFEMATQKTMLTDKIYSRFLKMESRPVRKPSVYKPYGDDSLNTRASEDHEPRVRNADSNQIDDNGRSTNQVGYNGQSLRISVSLDSDYLKGIAARGKEEKEGTKRKRTRRVPSSSQDYVGEDEYLDDETYLPYQVKRKRGRPSKIGVPVEQPKKRRGRPPKVKAALANATELQETDEPNVMRVCDYPSAADLKRMSSVSTDSQDFNGSSFGQKLSEKGEYLAQDAKQAKDAASNSYQGEVYDDKRECFVEDAKQDKRSSGLPVTTDFPTKANPDDFLVLDTAQAAQAWLKEKQAISDQSVNQVIDDENVIELSSNKNNAAFIPAHIKGSSLPEMISAAVKDQITDEGNHGDVFFVDQTKKQPVHVENLEKGYGDRIMKTNIPHNEEYSRDSEHSLASPVGANLQRIKDFPKEIPPTRHLTPSTSRSSSPIDRTYQIDLDVKVRSRRHRWYQKDTLHRDIEEAYMRMYPSVACETDQLMPEDVYYGENYPIIFADDDKVMMKFVDMSTAFKLAMKESAAKKQRSSSTEIVAPTVSHKEGKKTSERRRSSVQSLTDIHESEDTKIEASVIAKMQKRRAVVPKKPSKPNPPAKRKSIEADNDSDFVTDERKEPRVLDAENTQKPSHGMSLRPRRVLNLGEEYLSSDSFDEECGPDADTGSVYVSDESSDSEPLINKVRKSSSSNATKFARKTLSQKIEAISGESLKTFVDNAARQTTQHIETVLGNMPTEMPAKTSSGSFAKSLGPTGLSSKPSSDGFVRSLGSTRPSARAPNESFRKKIGPSRNVSQNLLQSERSNKTLKENLESTLDPGSYISRTLPESGASDTSKHTLVHVTNKMPPRRELNSSLMVDVKTENRSTENAVMTAPSNRDTVVISFDDLIASKAFTVRKEKHESEDSYNNDLAIASTEESYSEVQRASKRDMIAIDEKEAIVDLTSDDIVEKLSPVAEKTVVPNQDSGLERDYPVETPPMLNTIEVIKDFEEERRGIDVKRKEISTPASVCFEINNNETSTTRKTRVRSPTGSKHTGYSKDENQKLIASQSDDLYKDSLLSGITSDEKLISQESSSSSSKTVVVGVLGNKQQYVVKGRTEASKEMRGGINPSNDILSAGQEGETANVKMLGKIEEHQSYVTRKSQAGKQKLFRESEQTKDVVVGDDLQGKAETGQSQEEAETWKDLPKTTSQGQGEKHKLKEGPSVPKKDIAAGDVLQGEHEKGRSKAVTVSPKDQPDVTAKSNIEKHKLEGGLGCPKKDIVVVVEDILQGEAKKGKIQKEATAGQADKVCVEEEGSGDANENAKADVSCIKFVKSRDDCPDNSEIMIEKSKAINQEKSEEGMVFQQTEELTRESMIKDTLVSQNNAVVKDKSMTEDTSMVKDTSVTEDPSMTKDKSMANATTNKKKPTEGRISMQHISKESTVDTMKVMEAIASHELMDDKDINEESKTNTMENIKSDSSNDISLKGAVVLENANVKAKHILTSNTVENIKSNMSSDLSSKEVMVLRNANSETNDTQTVLEKDDTESPENITDIVKSLESITDAAKNQGKKDFAKENTVVSSAIKRKDVVGSFDRIQEESKSLDAVDVETAAPKKQRDKDTGNNGASKITNLIKRSIKAISETLSRAKVPKLETGSMNVQQRDDEKNIHEGEGKVDVAELDGKGKHSSQKEENDVLASNLLKVETDSGNRLQTQVKGEGEGKERLQESRGNKKVAESVDKRKQGLQEKEDTLDSSLVPVDRRETDVRHSGKALVSQIIENTDGKSSKPIADDSNSSEMKLVPEIIPATYDGPVGSKNTGDNAISEASTFDQLENSVKRESIVQPKNDSENESLHSEEQIKYTDKSRDANEQTTNANRPLCLMTNARGDHTDFKVAVSTASHISRQEDTARRSPHVADEAMNIDTIIVKSNTAEVINIKINENNAENSTCKVQQSEKYLGERSDLGLAVEERIYEKESSAKVSEMMVADKAPNDTESGNLCLEAAVNEDKHNPVVAKDDVISGKSMKTASPKMPGKLTESGDATKHESYDKSGKRGQILGDSSASDFVRHKGNAVKKPCDSDVSDAASRQSQDSAQRDSISTLSKNNEHFSKGMASTSLLGRQSPGTERHIEEIDAAQCLLGLFNSDRPSQSRIKKNEEMSTNLQQGESSGQEKNTRDTNVVFKESKLEVVVRGTTQDGKLVVASEGKMSSRGGVRREDKDGKSKSQSVTSSPMADKNKAVMDHDYTADFSTCDFPEASKSSPNKSKVSARSESTKITSIFMPEAVRHKDKTASKVSESATRQSQGVPQGSCSSPAAIENSLPALRTARDIFESFKFEQPPECAEQSGNMETWSSKRDRKDSDTGSVLEGITLGHNIGKKAIIVTKDSRRMQEDSRSDQNGGTSSKTDTAHRRGNVSVPKESSKKLEILEADICETKTSFRGVKSELESMMSYKVEKRSDSDHCEVGGHTLVDPKESNKKPEVLKADCSETVKRVTDSKSGPNISKDVGQCGPGNIFENMGISGISRDRKVHCKDSVEQGNTILGKEDRKKVIDEMKSSCADEVTAKKRKLSAGKVEDVKEEEFEDCQAKQSLNTKYVQQKQKNQADQFLRDSEIQTHGEDMERRNERECAELDHETQKSGRTKFWRSGQTSPERNNSGQTSPDAEISLYANETLDAVPDSQCEKMVLCNEILENADIVKAKEKGSEIDEKSSGTAKLVFSDKVKEYSQTNSTQLEGDAGGSERKEDVVCTEKRHDKSLQLGESSKENTRHLNPETTNETSNLASSAKLPKQEYLDVSPSNIKTVEPLETSGKEGSTTGKRTENEGRSVAEVHQERLPGKESCSSKKPDNSSAERDNKEQSTTEVLEDVSPAKKASSPERSGNDLADGPKDGQSHIMHGKQHEDKYCRQESDGTASSNKEKQGASHGNGSSTQQESETKRRQKEKKRKSADLELLDENKNVLTRGKRRHAGE